MIFRIERPYVGLIVAKCEGNPVGFVSYLPTDMSGYYGSQITGMWVDPQYRNNGLGKRLLYSLQYPVQVRKSVAESIDLGWLERHWFYEAQEGVWQLNRVFILCAGGSRYVTKLTKNVHTGYGSRHDNVSYLPQRDMLDINWERYVWDSYLKIAEREQPIWAMVPDYEDPTQKNLMLERVQELRGLGIQKIMVCPKFQNAIPDIPDEDDVVVAISIPSSYSGYLPPIPHIRERKNVHFLGGTWANSHQLMRRYEFQGARVTSVDENYFLRYEWGTFSLESRTFMPDSKPMDRGVHPHVILEENLRAHAYLWQDRTRYEEVWHNLPKFDKSTGHRILPENSVPQKRQAIDHERKETASGI